MSLLHRIRARVVATLEAGPLGRLRRTAVSFVRESLRDDVLGLSGELAYRWLLALFPLAILIAAISGFAARSLNVEDPTDRLLDAAGTSLPPEAAATIRPQLERILGEQESALLSLGLLLSLWAAAAGMKAIIKALNRAYDVPESRPFWRQNLIALGLTLLLGAAVVVSFIGLVTGQVAASDLASTLGLEEAAAAVFEIAPYPLAIGALGFASWFLYWRAPARRPTWKGAIPGAVFFVPGWIVATILFSFYVANFGSYADTYGALGGVIILLLWFYLTALLLVLGGELNAAIEREFGERASAAEDPAAREGTSLAIGEPLARIDGSTGG
ncbi:MAG: YihY/virulence factor BrkB family protein [Candidatus Limnocylindrales bacterium]